MEVNVVTVKHLEQIVKAVLKISVFFDHMNLCNSNNVLKQKAILEVLIQKLLSLEGKIRNVMKYCLVSNEANGAQASLKGALNT